jgi:hypothetical protein
LAKEKYTVIYSMQDAGGIGPANWAEKEVKVKGGEKNAGYVGSALKIGEPLMAKVVTIEAEGAEEAAEAVRKFYGQGIVTGKCLAGASSGLSEVSPQN